MILQVAGLLDGLGAAETTVVVLGATLALAVGFEAVGRKLVRRLVSRTECRIDDVLFEELRFPIVVTVFLSGVWVLTQAQGLTAVVGQAALDRFFRRPSLSIIVVAWAWALNRVVNRWVRIVQEERRGYEFAPVLSNVWTLAVLVGGAGLLLSLWRIDVTPLLGAAGIAGIAVGFAAKDTVANFFGGLALYFDDTYKLGDYVELEGGERGTVVKIGIRSTTLLTRSEVLVTVPNARLNAGKVINQSAPSRRKRIRVPVSVAYGTDPEVFEPIALRVAAAADLVVDSPEPRVRLRQLGSSALEYELLCWVPTPERAGRATHQLNRALYDELGAAGIEIPYPKRDLTVRQMAGATEDGADAPL